MSAPRSIYANTFTRGDLVKLRSGGKAMTVKFVRKDGFAYVCQWFTGDELCEAWFNAEMLVSGKKATKEESK